MSQPIVCCVMLTRDRPELAKRAVECFRAQTYENKWMLAFDTGEEWPEYDSSRGDDVLTRMDGGMAGRSIGALRNEAAKVAVEGRSAKVCGVDPRTPDIFIHFDDDDFSHPNRIAEQVALLQSSGADVVGYSDMLFWREPRVEYGQKVKDPHGLGMLDTGALHPGEAWLYTATKGCAPALGTSLCYWRKTWEKNPFPDQPKPGNMGSEYGNWLKALKCETRTSIERVCIGDVSLSSVSTESIHQRWEAQPRMIARIHAGNGSRDAYQLEKLVEGGSREWHRAPQWYEIVRGILA